MTKEQFKNKYVGKAVHCDTEEKAKEFLALAHDCGFKWLSGLFTLEKNRWFFNKDKTCYKVRRDNTITHGSLNYHKETGIEIIEFEIEEKKMKKTKKVFDLGLFVKWNIENGRSYVATVEDIDLWAWNYHGKTQEEMSEKVIHVADEWMKEVEVKVELSEKEIGILKALKVLDYEWIARDENAILDAYKLKPIKNISNYGGPEHARLDSTLFNFISWEDEQPTSIEELLKEC